MNEKKVSDFRQAQKDNTAKIVSYMEANPHMSNSSVALHFRRSYQSVFQIRKAAGLPPPIVDKTSTWKHWRHSARLQETKESVVESPDRDMRVLRPVTLAKTPPAGCEHSLVFKGINWRCASIDPVVGAPLCKFCGTQKEKV